MALAFIAAVSVGQDAVEVEADIGSNQYYSYVVGHRDDSAYRSRWGEDEMAEVSHAAPVAPAPPGGNPLGRTFRFDIPLDLFDRDHPDLQLVSYSDRAGNNPARSRSHRVAWMNVARAPDMAVYADGLPPARFTLSLSARGGQAATLPGAPVRHVALSFREVGISRAQFLDSILQAVSAAAPQLLNSIPDLLTKLAPSLLQAMPGLMNSAGGLLGAGRPNPAAPTGAPAATPSARAVEDSISNEVLVGLMRELVAALAAQSRSDGRAAPVAPPVLAASLQQRHARHPLVRAQAMGRFAARPMPRVPYARPMDGGIISGPLLISLLGAVAGPLLAQAPQLLGVLADKPLDFLATLLRAESENGLQREAGQQALMRDLLAETNRSLLMDQLIERLGQGGEGGGAAALLPLLAGAQSLGAAPGAHEARSVRLVFEAGPLVDVGGKLKSVFALGDAGIDLRITLQPIENAPKSPLPRAIAALVVTDPATGRRLLEKSFRLTDIEAGRPVPLHLDAADLSKLPGHTDLHAAVTLRWPTAAGKVLGVRGHHAFCLTDGPVFAGFGQSHATVIQMAHPGDDRAFWNKVWEGTAASDTDQTRWELDVLCRYYLRVTGTEETNGRMETRLAADPAAPGSTRAITGKMRAGMEISVDMLNAVAARHGNPLPPAFLQAFRKADLRPDLDREATTRLRLRGREGQLGVVWAFPGLVMRDVDFLEPVAQDDHGQVTGVRRTTLAFPVPDRVHFLAMRSKR